MQTAVLKSNDKPNLLNDFIMNFSRYLSTSKGFLNLEASLGSIPYLFALLKSSATSFKIVLQWTPVAWNPIGKKTLKPLILLYLAITSGRT